MLSVLRIIRAYNLLRLNIPYIFQTIRDSKPQRTVQTTTEARKQAKIAEETPVGIVIDTEAKKTTMFKEAYPIQEPYVYAAIVKDPETHKTRYEIIEPTFKKEEERQLKDLKSFLMEEVDVNLKDIETREKAERLEEFSDGRSRR
jgi:hypothetical protein